jgi:hypothetical protein
MDILRYEYLVLERFGEGGSSEDILYASVRPFFLDGLETFWDGVPYRCEFGKVRKKGRVGMLLVLWDCIENFEVNFFLLKECTLFLLRILADFIVYILRHCVVIHDGHVRLLWSWNWGGLNFCRDGWTRGFNRRLEILSFRIFQYIQEIHLLCLPWEHARGNCKYVILRKIGSETRESW